MLLLDLLKEGMIAACIGGATVEDINIEAAVYAAAYDIGKIPEGIRNINEGTFRNAGGEYVKARVFYILPGCGVIVKNGRVESAGPGLEKIQGKCVTVCYTDQQGNIRHDTEQDDVIARAVDDVILVIWKGRSRWRDIGALEKEILVKRMQGLREAFVL